jgi:UDP-N-acetylmuramoylalanine--D-glutamate ligase
VYTDAIEDEWIVPPRSAGWGDHDRGNAQAAWALCRIYGISQPHFLSALKTFQKPHHRIEFVCEIDGICYYDDSKGTNIDAVIHAVGAMSGPVILIAGGVDKGASYLPWADKLKKKIKRILVLGQAAEKIERELCLVFEVERVDSLAMAVESARSIAVKGDTILLSPGCSSFDMFEDYAHRGREFKRLITRGAL